jgi:hypothetical protein
VLHVCILNSNRIYIREQRRARGCGWAMHAGGPLVSVRFHLGEFRVSSTLAPGSARSGRSGMPLNRKFGNTRISDM